MAGWNPYNPYCPPAKRFCPDSAICCRVCDRIFPNFHALLDHAERHTTEDILAMLRQQEMNNFSAQFNHFPGWNNMNYNYNPVYAGTASSQAYPQFLHQQIPPSYMGTYPQNPTMVAPQPPAYVATRPNVGNAPPANTPNPPAVRHVVDESKSRVAKFRKAPKRKICDFDDSGTLDLNRDSESLDLTLSRDSESLDLNLSLGGLYR